jgi:dTMP kinase
MISLHDRGRFITLEGGEGAGKSTQAGFIRGWLAARGRRVLLTREPGGTPLAEAIRGLVLGDWLPNVDPMTELLLLFAARSHHWTQRIRPALDDGIDVVCDRFVDASFAYQGAGRQLGAAAVQTLQQLVLADHRPDLTLLLDIAPEAGLARARGRGDTNRFEDETLAFMHRVRAAYLERAAATPERYVVIDAAQPPAAVRDAIESALIARLNPAMGRTR